MPRTKTLIHFATLNDRGGDLSQTWYVEYSFQLPGSEAKYRRRIYNGLGSNGADERRAIAARYIEEINTYLKSGEYLNHDADFSPVTISDGFRPEQQAYMEKMEKLRVGVLVPEFLEWKRPELKTKSQQEYLSRMKMFVKFVQTDLNDKLCTQIEQEDIIRYARELSTKRGWCKQTICKSVQMARVFFNYLEFMGVRPKHSNPVYDIPKFGKVVDCSPMPYVDDERERLRSAIEVREPYLWLACQMIYYCAIRPGTELRLLKIKHINRQTHSITIPADLAKNKKRETVVMPDVLYSMMEKLNLFMYDPELYIFGKNGAPSDTPTGKNTMRNRFNLFRDACGISQDHKFYSWKHSGAISALMNGANPMELRDHLRHRSLETTEGYIKKWAPKNDTSKYIGK